MKNHLKTKFRFTLPELALFVLLLAEFCFVAYANFRLIERTLDCDSAMLMTHAAEMWHTKHVFIPSWVMETMLEIDTALLPAVPLYALFGNIYTAFGLANILVLLAYWFFFCSLLKRMGQSRTARLASCVLVTIPWSFGQLLYFNMMFFSGGYYGIKVLLPLMLIWLLTTKKEDRGALFYVIFALTTFFSFAFSISTGPYSLICVVVAHTWQKAKAQGDPLRMALGPKIPDPLCAGDRRRGRDPCKCRDARKFHRQQHEDPRLP